MTEKPAGRLDPGFVRLEASAPFGGAPSVVADLLRGDPAAWLGEAEPRGVTEDGYRRYAIDLRLRVGGDETPLLTLGKAALLDLGEVSAAPEGYEVEIGWRASTAAPLFPVFSGTLSVGHELRIEGIYAPPGGVVGRIADRVLLHTAANGTARWLLRQLADAATRPPR
jgi:hypothetical protein